MGRQSNCGYGRPTYPQPGGLRRSRRPRLGGFDPRDPAPSRIALDELEAFDGNITADIQVTRSPVICRLRKEVAPDPLGLEHARRDHEPQSSRLSHYHGFCIQCLRLGGYDHLIMALVSGRVEFYCRKPARRASSARQVRGRPARRYLGRRNGGRAGIAGGYRLSRRGAYNRARMTLLPRFRIFF